MQQQFSWWFIDQEHAALVNPSTKQRVRYIAKASDEVELGLWATAHRYWMQFEYEDPECRYPLLVEWRNSIKSPGRSLVWRIDHVRSAKLWARQNSSGSEHPPYGLWRRVDVAVGDALSCWPSMNATGPALSDVWINGGWCNGVWRNEFYRFLSRSSKDMRSRWFVWMPPLDAPVPSPWEFVGQAVPPENVIRSWLSKFRGKTIDGNSFEQILARSLIHGLPDKAYCGPHLRSRDGSRALIPIEYINSQRDKEEHTIKIRLLYMDQDLICDCLTLTRRGFRNMKSASKTWECTFEHVVSRIGHGGIVPRDSYAGPSYFPTYWIDRETVIPRSELWYRFAYAVTEAWLKWEDTTLTLPQRHLPEMVQVTIPSAIRVGLPVVANTGSILRGHVAESLASASSTGHAIVLDDHAPEVPATVVRRNVGWWSIDGNAIRKTASNQCIRLVETSGAQTWDSSDLWFRYSDSDVAYPVLVRRRLTGQSGNVSGTWEIDHELSAERWRTDTNTSKPFPSFGLWRRVEDAVADALYCWRELEQTTHQMQILSTGGWWNGAWRPDWRREWWGLPRSNLDRLEGTPAAAVLEPLDEPVPPAWAFVECPKDVVRLELAHVDQLPGGIAFLPPDAPLEGFKGHTSYLTRIDDSAVLFPSYASGRWDYRAYPDREDYYVGVGYFTYANESEFLSCAFDGESQGFTTHRLTVLGSRTQAGAASMLTSAGNTSPGVLARATSYPIWRRLTFDLLQAWPNWRGTGSRLLEDPEQFDALRRSSGSRSRRLPRWEQSGIALETPNKVKIIGGYVGGLCTWELRISSNIPSG